MGFDIDWGGPSWMGSLFLLLLVAVAVIASGFLLRIAKEARDFIHREQDDENI